MTKEDAMDYLARCADESDPEYSTAVALAVSALRAQVEEEKNEPLTLEELREMDGEPVWVVEPNDYPPRWGLVYWCRKNKRDEIFVTLNNCVAIKAESFINGGGKIYRHKPPEPVTP